MITNPNADIQVNWTIDTGGVNWVTVRRNTGVLQAGGRVTVNVTSNPSLLPSQAGTYTTDLKVTFSSSLRTDVTSILIPVTMTVP